MRSSVLTPDFAGIYTRHLLGVCARLWLLRLGNPFKGGITTTQTKKTKELSRLAFLEMVGVTLSIN